MKTAIIIGSTGLVGSRLLNILAQDKRYSAVYSISRNKPHDLPEKATHIPFEGGNYDIPHTCDVAFCCLGTTMKKAGSKEAFLTVDFGMVVDFARKAKVTGINHLAVVSSIGANAGSSNFYLGTKGRVEEQLKQVGFERLVIVRPSLLLGKRSEKRFGEDMGKVFYSLFKFVLVGPLRKYRGIDAGDVAKAMIVLADKGEGTVVAESNELVVLSGQYNDESLQTR
ncbi:MAG: oxidoreductase [Bacteroidales bacterium]|nr:oxidoreductase [Bacteroidales bacterium]